MLLWAWSEFAAFTDLGLKFRAYVSLLSDQPLPRLFLQSWDPEIDQHQAHLFPLFKGTVCPPRQKKNPLGGGRGSQLHVHLSCLLPIDSQNFDDRQIGEFIRPISSKFNHNQLGHLSPSSRVFIYIYRIGLKNKWVSGRIQTGKS